MAIRNAKSLSMFTTGLISLNRFYELDLFFWNKMTKFWFCLHFVNFFVNFYVNIFVEVFTSEWVLAAWNYPNSKVVSWLNRKSEWSPLYFRGRSVIHFYGAQFYGRPNNPFLCRTISTSKMLCGFCGVQEKSLFGLYINLHIVRNASLLLTATNGPSSPDCPRIE